MYGILQPINPERRKLSDFVYQSLLRAILSRKIRAGTRLCEEEVAEQLNVSRTPVREALNQLEREGLVRRVPHKGAEVTRLDESDLEEIFDLLEVIAGLASRMAARRITDSGLEGLVELNELAAECLECRGREKYREVDREFHHRIIDASGSRRIGRLFDIHEHQISALLPDHPPEGGDPRRDLKEHGELITALEKGDGKVAEGLTRRHLRRNRDLLLDAVLGNL